MCMNAYINFVGVCMRACVRVCVRACTCVCVCQPMSLVNTGDSPVGRVGASGHSRAVVSKSTAKAVPPTVGECGHMHVIDKPLPRRVYR